MKSTSKRKPAPKSKGRPSAAPAAMAKSKSKAKAKGRATAKGKGTEKGRGRVEKSHQSRNFNIRGAAKTSAEAARDVGIGEGDTIASNRGLKNPNDDDDSGGERKQVATTTATATVVTTVIERPPIPDPRPTLISTSVAFTDDTVKPTSTPQSFEDGDGRRGDHGSHGYSQGGDAGTRGFLMERAGFGDKEVVGVGGGEAEVMGVVDGDGGRYEEGDYEDVRGAETKRERECYTATVVEGK